MSREMDDMRATLAQEDLMMLWRNRLQGHAPIIAHQLRGEPPRCETAGDMLYAGVQVTQQITKLLSEWGLPTEKMDPGHGMGHMFRDHVSALLIAIGSDELPLNERFVSIIAGSLHDVGCAIFNRYDDANGVVRHADAGAVLLESALSLIQDVTEPEAKAIVYAVAAHTNYLKPLDMKDRSGITHTIQPFPDMIHETPMWFVHLTRWADRLDVSGPTFVARHFLTLDEGHKEYGTDVGFYDTEFASTMRPLLRTPEEIKQSGHRTMLEHLDMFVKSQTNASPYGCLDNPSMQRLRDARAHELRLIIEAVRDPRFDMKDESRCLDAWGSFLSLTIEPDPQVGLPRAQTLIQAFRRLPDATRQAWLSGFMQTMRSYHDAWYPQLFEACLRMNELAPGIQLSKLELFGRNSRFMRPSNKWKYVL